MKAIDLVGKRFGRLVVVERADNHSTNKHANAHWVCKCDCGNETVVDGHKLRRGHTKSCGCYHKDRLVTHGETNSRLYGIWKGLKWRCNSKSDRSYKYYGGRGIKVCDEWEADFQAFYDWAMENGYRDDLSIDRIDNDGNYEPENCRWVSAKEQANNRRNNIIITRNGETHTLAEWAEILGIKYSTLQKRIQGNWNIERAFAVYRLVGE